MIDVYNGQPITIKADIWVRDDNCEIYLLAIMKIFLAKLA